MPNGFDEEEAEGEKAEELEDQQRSAREAIRERGKEMAKEAFKKAVVEPVKKAAVEAGKRVATAIGQMMTKAALALGKLLIATIPYWGPVVLALIAVILIAAVILSVVDDPTLLPSVLKDLKGDSWKDVQFLWGAYKEP